MPSSLSSLFVAALLAPALTLAQPAAPSVQNGSAVADEAGYSLRTAGGVEPYNWGTPDPILRFNFSIERADRRLFTGLSTEGILAAIDEAAPPDPSTGTTIPVHSGDLQVSRASATSVMVVIDGSGSMVVERAGQSIDKLSAAKAAINHFIDQLQPNDRVAVVAFDDTPRVVAGLGDKGQAKAAVSAFNIKLPGARYTALYDAMKFAIARAKLLGIRHVVFLTDGMEDTPQFNRLTPAGKNDYRQRREAEIAAQAHLNDVRIYAIGIGNRNAPETDLAFVDFNTLNRITRETAHLDAHYVDLPDLAAAAANNNARYGQLLVDTLQSFLADISKAFHYDYTLVLRPDYHLLRPDAKEHRVGVVFAVENVRLPMEFSYRWEPGKAPEVNPPVVKKPFLQLDQKIDAATLLTVYLVFFAALVALASIPAIRERILARRQALVANQAVVTMREPSPYIGRECPNEQGKLGRDFLIRRGDVVVLCPRCGRAHHLGCWHLSGDTCWDHTCGEYLAIDPEILAAHGVED